MLAHSFLIVSSSKLLITRTGIKARTSSILGLWFPWPIYMFFEMRFDLGTLDSGERSLPFGLLVIAIAWDETSILVTVHFSMKTFTSYVIGAKPWCGTMSASTNNVLCLMTCAWRWSRIAMTLSAGVPHSGCSKISVRQNLISNIRKTSLIWYRIIMHIWLII